MHMKWYKIWRGLPFDPRLAVTAKRAGISRAESIAVYIALLDIASAASPLGSLDHLDAEELSLQIDVPAERIEAALTALRAKKMISPENRITCWAGRPSSSTLRVRTWRAKQKQASKISTPPQTLHPDHPQAVAARRERLQQDNPPRRPNA